MFFPYDDINPSERTPYVTWTIIGLNVAAFLATLQLLSLPPEQQLAAYRDFGALVPAEPEPLDFLTSMFLHGGVMHLVGNMLFLYITGDNIEDEFGHIPYIVFYLASGVAASWAHILVAGPSTVPLVGASGAISGVMGAYVVLFPHSRIKIFYWFYFFIGHTRIRAIWWLGLWIGFQVFAGAAAGASGGGVAYAAHVGGFVVGAAVAFAGKLLGWLEGGVDSGPPGGNIRGGGRGAGPAQRW